LTHIINLTMTTCTTAYYLEGNAHRLPPICTRIVQRKVGHGDGHKRVCKQWWWITDCHPLGQERERRWWWKGR
jgi:hypothetical protein